jgi:hypothetical protein
MLYYNVVRSYRNDNNPWISQYLFWSNGDGTLVYPGLPAFSAIDTHKPAPSLRLKILRDGFEDYEYLVLYKQLSGHSSAEEIATTVARKSLRWEHDLSSILAVRNEIAATIEGD